MVKAKRFALVKKFEGLPKATDFQIVEEELRPIKDGEFLVEAVYISVDPCQRVMPETVTPVGGGETFSSSQVAKVIESKNPKYPAGKYVVAQFGWRTHTIGDNSPSPSIWPDTWVIPDFEGLPLSLGVGVLGMPGITAYFGFLEICKPKPGETVVVSGAAGAVGSIVGQIAKIKGCTVVGIAGSDEKGNWLVNDLKFDSFVNYNDPDFEKKLAKAVPKGVDCYFDNVGGEISLTVLNLMNQFGRVSVCGLISGYNNNNIQQGKGGGIPFAILLKQLKIEGFGFIRWLDRWFEGIGQLKKWIKEGKLQYRETVTEGFENTFKAFVDMLQGGNVGKAVVKV